MFKKTVDYKDFNGVAQTGTYWFHLSEAEVTTIEYEAVTSQTLGLVDMIEKIVADMKGKEMIAIIANLVEKSYGIRSTDGARFIKSPELFAEFKSTGAYAKIFFELQTNADLLVEWFSGLLPENLAEIAEEAKKRAGVQDAETIRQRSAARMAGFKQKEEKVTVVTDNREVPRIYTPELSTAAPVLESAVDQISVVPTEISGAIATPDNSHLSPNARPDLWPADAAPLTHKDEYAAFQQWKAQQAEAAQA